MEKSIQEIMKAMCGEGVCSDEGVTCKSCGARLTRWHLHIPKQGKNPPDPNSPLAKYHFPCDEQNLYYYACTHCESQDFYGYNNGKNEISDDSVFKHNLHLCPNE